MSASFWIVCGAVGVVAFGISYLLALRQHKKFYAEAMRIFRGEHR